MMHEKRDAVSKVGTRGRTTGRWLLHAAAFLISVGALAGVAGCGADAATQDEVLHQGSTPMGLDGDEHDPTIIQTPPVKMKLTFDGTTLLAMAALGSLDTGHYARETEYWHAADELKLIADVRLEAVQLANETERSLDDWLSAVDPAFTCRRPVAATDWSKGVAPTMPTMASYLLWAPHPDDANEILALQLVVNTQGRLNSAIWYRSTAPLSDGLAFRANTWDRSMRLLVDVDGRPAVDPNLIAPADWYYIQMPLP